MRSCREPFGADLNHLTISSLVIFRLLGPLSALGSPHTAKRFIGLAIGVRTRSRNFARTRITSHDSCAFRGVLRCFAVVCRPAVAAAGAVAAGLTSDFLSGVHARYFNGLARLMTHRVAWGQRTDGLGETKERRIVFGLLADIFFSTFSNGLPPIRRPAAGGSGGWRRSRLSPFDWDPNPGLGPALPAS